VKNKKEMTKEEFLQYLKDKKEKEDEIKKLREEEKQKQIEEEENLKLIANRILEYEKQIFEEEERIKEEQRIDEEVKKEYIQMQIELENAKKKEEEELLGDSDKSLNETQKFEFIQEKRQLIEENKIKTILNDLLKDFDEENMNIFKINEVNEEINQNKDENKNENEIKDEIKNENKENEKVDENKNEDENKENEKEKEIEELKKQINEEKIKIEKNKSKSSEQISLSERIITNLIQKMEKLTYKKIEYDEKMHRVIYDSVYTVPYMSTCFEEFLKIEINDGPFRFAMNTNNLISRIKETNDALPCEVLEKFIELSNEYIFSNDKYQINISSDDQKKSQTHYDAMVEYINKNKKVTENDVVNSPLNIMDIDIIKESIDLFSNLSSLMYYDLFLDSVNNLSNKKVSKISPFKSIKINIKKI
jgi:hypothetical protein